jgi:serine/threonine protein phosphatase PrpC
MEDAWVSVGNFAGLGSQYYGLFDGHGGAEASHYCAEHLHHIIVRRAISERNLCLVIKHSIYEINREITARWTSAGTTAAVVVIANSHIYTANVGDSRIIFVSHGRIERMTVDHHASVPSERFAIMARGGRVTSGRVNGTLMLSRAIGDGDLARYISCEPHMSVRPFRKEYRIIIACDGVWDVMSDEEAVDILNASKTPAEAARLIRDEALRLGSEDNVSVSCIDLRHGMAKTPQKANRNAKE